MKQFLTVDTADLDESQLHQIWSVLNLLKTSFPDAISFSNQESLSRGTPPPKEEVKWVINSDGELGVEVYGVQYWYYRGESIVYGTTLRAGSAVRNSSDYGPLTYRYMKDKEFGRCLYPAMLPAHVQIPPQLLADEWKVVLSPERSFSGGFPRPNLPASLDIAGQPVTLEELRADVIAAKKKYRYTDHCFTWATVQSLLEAVTGEPVDLDEGPRSSTGAAGEDAELTLDEELIAMIRGGEALKAVKHKRDKSGLGLKEARDYVMRLARSHQLSLPVSATFGNY